VDEFIVSMLAAGLGSFIGVIVAIDLYYRMEGRRIMGQRWEFKWPNPRFWRRTTAADTSTAPAHLSGALADLSSTHTDTATTATLTGTVSDSAVSTDADEFKPISSLAYRLWPEEDPAPLRAATPADLVDEDGPAPEVWHDTADEFEWPEAWPEEDGDEEWGGFSDEFNRDLPALEAWADVEAAYGDAPPVDPDEFNPAADETPARDEFNAPPYDGPPYGHPAGTAAPTPPPYDPALYGPSSTDTPTPTPGPYDGPMRDTPTPRPPLGSTYDTPSMEAARNDTPEDAAYVDPRQAIADALRRRP
jgi:hypothetical protein